MNVRVDKQIFVKVNDKTLTINTFPNMTIKSLKNIIYKKTNIPNEIYYLSYGSKILEPNKFLQDYYINKESTLYLHFRFVKKNPPKFNIMNTVDANKRVLAENVAIKIQRPCIVEINYYIITPLGNHYYGNSEYIKKKLSNESFTFNEVIAIENNIFAD